MDQSSLCLPHAVHLKPECEEWGHEIMHVQRSDKWAPKAMQTRHRMPMLCSGQIKKKDMWKKYKNEYHGKGDLCTLAAPSGYPLDLELETPSHEI